MRFGFDELCKAMATDVPRRSAVKFLAAGVAAAFWPKRGAAQVLGCGAVSLGVTASGADPGCVLNGIPTTCPALMATALVGVLCPGACPTTVSSSNCVCNGATAAFTANTVCQCPTATPIASGMTCLAASCSNCGTAGNVCGAGHCCFGGMTCSSTTTTTATCPPPNLQC